MSLAHHRRPGEVERVDEGGARDERPGAARRAPSRAHRRRRCRARRRPVIGRIMPRSPRPRMRQASAVGNHHVKRYALLSGGTMPSDRIRLMKWRKRTSSPRPQPLAKRSRNAVPAATSTRIATTSAPSRSAPRGPRSDAGVSLSGPGTARASRRSRAARQAASGSCSAPSGRAYRQTRRVPLFGALQLPPPKA